MRRAYGGAVLLGLAGEQFIKTHYQVDVSTLRNSATVFDFGFDPLGRNLKIRHGVFGSIFDVGVYDYKTVDTIALVEITLTADYQIISEDTYVCALGGDYYYYLKVEMRAVTGFLDVKLSYKMSDVGGHVHNIVAGVGFGVYIT